MSSVVLVWGSLFESRVLGSKVWFFFFPFSRYCSCSCPWGMGFLVLGGHYCSVQADLCEALVVSLLFFFFFRCFLVVFSETLWSVEGVGV